MPEVDVVFCTDLTDLPGQMVPEEHREYAMFLHEAEVFMWALANAVEEGQMTPEEALEEWEPYQGVWPLDDDLLAEFDEGFPTTNWFMDWAPGPGSENFWRAADELEVPGVVYSEGDHPGGSPYFYVRGREALGRVAGALAGSYKVLVLDQEEYDTSSSSDLERAKRIIERGRGEPGVAKDGG